MERAYNGKSAILFFIETHFLIYILCVSRHRLIGANSRTLEGLMREC